MALRHKARECALQMLYQWEMTGVEPARVEASFWKTARGAPDTKSFANKLLEGTVAGSAEADRLIAQHAQNWRVERLAAIDRNILRLAVYELLAGEEPAKVVINEAIELVRTYSESAAGPFVNGILDAIRKSLPAPEKV